MSNIDPNSPVLPPPADVQANLDARSELNTPAFAELWLSLVLVTLVAIARVLGRWRVSCVSRPHPVDIMTFVGYTLYIGVIYCIYRIIGYDKLFVHQWDLRVKDRTGLLRIKFVAVNIYNPLILLLKSAILFEWIHILLPVGKRNAFFWTCQLLAWTNILYYVTVMFVWNFACTPYEKNWDRNIPGSCMNFKALDMGSAIVNFSTNLVMIFLPVASVRRLKYSGKMRLGVFTIFGFGLLACIASAFRFVSGIYFYTTEDLNYHFSSITLWVLAEMTGGFIVLCAPSVPAAISLLSNTRLFSHIGSKKMMQRAMQLNNIKKSHTGTSTNNDEQDDLALAAAHNPSPWRDVANDDNGENSKGTVKMTKRMSQLSSLSSSSKWFSDMKGSSSSSGGNNHSKMIKPKNKSNGESSSHGRSYSGLSLSALTEALHSSLSAATSTEQLRSSTPGGDSSGDLGTMVSDAGGILCTTQIVTTEDFVPIDERMKETGGWKSPWEEREGDEEYDQELGLSVRVL